MKVESAADLETLMLLARKHGAQVVKVGDVSMVMGPAPNAATVAAQPNTIATIPAISPLLAAAITEATALDDDEPTPAERREVEAFERWQRGEALPGDAA